MAGLAGMDEIGRGTRGCQSGSPLASHMTAFAHARDRNAPLYAIQTIHHLAERGVQTTRQQRQGMGFLPQYRCSKRRFPQPLLLRRAGIVFCGTVSWQFPVMKFLKSMMLPAPTDALSVFYMETER